MKKQYVVIQRRGNETREIFEAHGKEVLPYALVETEWGEEIGWVLGVVSRVEKKKIKGEVKQFFDGSEKKLESYFLNAKKKEKEAEETFRELIKKYKLDREGMRPVKTYLTFDQKRLIFYYTAPQRVDFRNLLKELISLFPQIIRLQQITPRQSALMQGGVGPCGRELCCHRFLTDLPKITPEMVQEQLSAVASKEKLKGVCGRLRCCLLYEQQFYQEAHKRLPKIGENVKIGEKEGEVVASNVLRNEVTVKFRDGTTATVKAEEIKKS